MPSNCDGIEARAFVKLLGLGAASSVVALSGCDKHGHKSGSGDGATDIPTDQMTYRTNQGNGDKVSLLGYGCMRLPRRPKAAATGDEDNVNQNAVNASVDYALDHGVNYFDTSPRYCKGRSERATGIALSRHPRSKYLIATKICEPVGQKPRGLRGHVSEVTPGSEGGVLRLLSGSFRGRFTCL